MVGSVEGASGNDDTVTAESCPTHKPIDTESVRAALKKFVDSLDDTLDIEPSQRERGYHPNAEDQGSDYNICTVVQQCKNPSFILSLGYMSPEQRGMVYKALSKATSQESFNMLQLQQHSNLLLGEMQDWATTCDGTCRELNDPNGLLEPVPEGSGTLPDQSTEVPSTSFEACRDLRGAGNYTFWYCNDEPRMVHHANIDVTSGKYKLGNIFTQPHTHGRNSQYDYFSTYGDLEENGGAFGMRFSGHHIDLNFEWNDEGELANDLPVFLGHNPLIVPSTVPPQVRASDDRLNPNHFNTPLMWNNMAGVAQFAESVQLVLDCANELLDIAPESYVPMSEWESTGYLGALQLKDKDLTDYDYFDLSTATETEFNKIWPLVEYTLTFSRGNGSTKAERDLFRSQGKAIWTTSSPPEEGLPLNEDDLRSNLNFLNLWIATDDLIFFVMVNQLYTVVSENEPTNHLHSVIISKSLVTPNHACIDDDDPLCIDPPRDDDHDDNHDVDHHAETISNIYKYESSMWEQRNLVANVTLDVDVFDTAIQRASDELCGLGITATLFDANAEQVLQKSYGTNYYGMGSYMNHSNEEIGWTGDTVFSLYSNSKMVTAFTYLASVVETGLGYLDEPIYLSFPDILTKDDLVGRATPRMILSHTSGLPSYDRTNATDPYYQCKYDDSTTLVECLSKYVLTDESLSIIPATVPGTYGQYSNEPFDVLAVLTARKTGLDNYGEVFKKYVGDPIGMDSTSLECPITRSTTEKPHPSWGFCSTGHDMAKLIQVLTNKGSTKDGIQVISASLVQQMFSRGTGIATNGDNPLFFLPMTFTRCYNRIDTSFLNSIAGYGLGTMHFPGPKGHWFGHAGSSGGFWMVAPGRWSAYVAWMANSDANTGLDDFVDFHSASYPLIVNAFDKLEMSSSYMVRNGGYIEEQVIANEEFFKENGIDGSKLIEFEEVDEVCGGDLYVDLLSYVGAESLLELVPPPPCATQERRRASEGVKGNAKAKLLQQRLKNALHRSNGGGGLL